MTHDMKQGRALAEVAEKNATGMTAELYDDIRRSLNVEQVNLIYRHFATIEGALPWAWGILRPYFVNGEIGQYAEKSLSLYAIDSALAGNFPRIELAEQEHSNIRGILDFYLKANPMNLFALEILNGELGSTSKAHWPLLRCDDLLHRAQSQQFDSTAEKLMYFVSQGVEGVRPTLLRQLAGWPHYVKSIAGFVTTICVDERFLIQVNGVREFAVERVRDMAPRETSSSLATKSAETMHAFCGYFPVPLIRMTIIAQYLRMSLSTELIIQ